MTAVTIATPIATAGTRNGLPELPLVWVGAAAEVGGVGVNDAVGVADAKTPLREEAEAMELKTIFII
jgi:hypothetical protein